MIDIDLIRREPERVRAALLKRMDTVDLDPILELDRRRRALSQEVSELGSKRNALAEAIGRKKRAKEDTSQLEAEATALRDQLMATEAALGETEAALKAEMEVLPNLPLDRVVKGGKEANQVVKVWGEQPDPASKPRDHVELAHKLGLVDFERGTKLGGHGFWIYTGLGAALEWALIDFFCREHYKDGYTFLLPPHMLLDACGYAAGQFPKFRDDVFHISPDSSDRGLFLLPTAETAILNVYRDEILSADQLPIKAFAYTPCYRREAGSHRTDERGTVRGHQFNKVEMFQFTTPEQGEQALMELVRKTETLVEKLGLHYRTSLLAAGDASASMQVTYDVEVWIPSMKTYKEVSSASYAGDYQARRAGIRYRPEAKAKPRLVHTLNASGLATSRVFPAMLEQHQQPDGSFVVPEPLRAWVGRDVIYPVR